MTTAAIRVPLVAGIDAGVGTSTLAAALHARDGGVLTQQADVVVCAATEESLRAAAAVACPGTGPRPVLVVTGGPSAVPVPAALRTRYCAVVELPRVDDWAGGAGVADAAADVLGVPADQLSAPLRAYADALRSLVPALLGAGVLAAGAPPMVIRPRPSEAWRGAPRPVPHPVRPAVSVEPRDDRTTPARHRLPDSAPCTPATPDPDESDSRPTERDESRSRPEGPRGGGTERAAGGRAPRRAGTARGTRPPRRTADARPATGRAHRAGRDEDDESIEARNLAADRAPAVRGRAG